MNHISLTRNERLKSRVAQEKKTQTLCNKAPSHSVLKRIDCLSFGPPKVVIENDKVREREFRYPKMTKTTGGRVYYGDRDTYGRISTAQGVSYLHLI